VFVGAAPAGEGVPAQAGDRSWPKRAVRNWWQVRTALQFHEAVVSTTCWPAASDLWHPRARGRRCLFDPVGSKSSRRVDVSASRHILACCVPHYYWVAHWPSRGPSRAGRSTRIRVVWESGPSSLRSGYPGSCGRYRRQQVNERRLRVSLVADPATCISFADTTRTFRIIRSSQPVLVPDHDDVEASFGLRRLLDARDHAGGRPEQRTRSVRELSCHERLSSPSYLPEATCVVFGARVSASSS